MEVFVINAGICYDNNNNNNNIYEIKPLNPCFIWKT